MSAVTARTPPVTSRLPQVGTTIFTVMSALATQHKAVNLGQGFPDFDCDPALVETVAGYMRAGHNQYAPMPGVLALREALAAKIERLYGRRYDPVTEITITTGATEALFASLTALVRPGDEVTVVAWGTMVHVAAAAIAEADIDAELIDVRTLVPLDLPAIVHSVEKTGRCIVVHEAPRTCGFGAEVVALVQQHCFWNLEAPIVRVTGWDTPFPHAQEWQYMPSRERIASAMRSALAA